MRALLQRVSEASVTVEGETVGRIGPGLLVLAGVRKGDTEEDASWLAGKIAGLRIFPDGERLMNRSVADVGGEILLISQFTLYGDARKGRRPSFEEAARPEEAIPLLDLLRRHLEASGLTVATGRFGAHMIVELVNDGPVTLQLDSRTARRGNEAPSATEPSAGTSDEEPVPSGRLRILSPDSPLQEVPLVLASASPRRRDLLRDLGLTFQVRSPDVDETADLPESPPERAAALAERKARAVAEQLSECLVLAADTLVVKDGRVYGKPADDDDAIRILRELSGSEHQVITGVCVAHAARRSYRTRTVATTVRFRAIGEEEIRRYVHTGEPYGKAGAYAIQGLGALLVAGIRGDYSNVVGLPMGATLDLIEEILRSGSEASHS